MMDLFEADNDAFASEEYFVKWSEVIKFYFTLGDSVNIGPFKPAFCNQYIPEKIDVLEGSAPEFTVILDLNTLVCQFDGAKDSCGDSIYDSVENAIKNLICLEREPDSLTCDDFLASAHLIEDGLYYFEVTELNERIEKFHQRLNLLTLSYIDAASFIEYDDQRWKLYYLFAKNSDGKLCLAGYCTVYEFWVYPDRMRPRISQFIVLPPFQRKSYGTKFLNEIFKHYHNLDKVCDISVEDPSEEFSILFSSIELYLVIKNSSTDLREKSPAVLKKKLRGFLRDTFKISRERIMMMSEMLALYACDNQEEVAEWRKVVMNRMVDPLQKRLKRTLNVKEKYSQSVKAQVCADLQQSLSSLSDILDSAEELYLKILTRCHKICGDGILKPKRDNIEAE